jgi:hypothetical protein
MELADKNNFLQIIFSVQVNPNAQCEQGELILKQEKPAIAGFLFRDADFTESNEIKTHRTYKLL